MSLSPRLSGYVLTAVPLAAASMAIAVSLQYTDDLLCGVINAGLFLLPLLLLAALTGRRAASLALATTVSLSVWGLGELKQRYFGDRLALTDVYFLSERANWIIVGHYPFVQAVLAAFVLLALLLALWAWRAEQRLRPYRPATRILCSVLLLLWCSVAWSGRTHHQWEVFRDDADCGTVKICGVMSRLLFSSTVFEFAPPLPRGEPRAFLQAAASLPPRPVSTLRPDVVVWLHESTLDPRLYRLDHARLPRLRFLESDASTRARGLLRVHTFGGKTWLSEFSLLTGLVPDDFGGRRSLVFNSVSPQLRSHLVARFDAAGYDTVVLMPTPRHFYGAARTYASLGFDRVLTLRDFPEYDAIPGDEWDLATSERLGEAAAKLLQEQRRAHPERPIFLYLLSVKEHAPYKRLAPRYDLATGTLPKSLAGKLTDYVDRLRRLDRGVAQLETELRSGARPALWAFFGDHQAYFEEESPPYRLELPQPDLITQYQLRATHPLSIDAPALLDIALLPSLIADGAGLTPDAFFQAQSAMRRLCGGGLRDCPDQALVASYKAHLYSPALALFVPATLGLVVP